MSTVLTTAGADAMASLPGDMRGEGLPRRFRPDIEGVRALAVLLVVLYHAGLLGVTGGFVGVDVFFVLSGFLITRQLVAGIGQRGIRELPGFYARRIRRLLPASAAVVIATVLASYVWLPPLQAKSVTKDAIFTSFYALNYRLAHDGTSYLHQGAAVSPLQHFWSLTVEEQFYVVWPILIFTCLLLPLRARHGALLALMSGTCAMSFCLSATTTSTHPSWAYFGLHTRAWELAAGGLIALTSARWTHLPARASDVLAWGAFAIIVGCAWTLDDNTRYPGVAAAVPVLATATILVAGCAPRVHSLERLLSQPAVQGLGKVSYSWYLWHWPMLVILTSVAGGSLPWPRQLEIIVLSLGFAVISYRLIENPLRRRQQLDVEWVGLGVALAAVVIAVAVITNNAIATTGTGPTAGPVDLSGGRPEAALTRALNLSLSIRKVPRNLTPHVDKAGDDVSVNWHNGCQQDITQSIRLGTCASGDLTADRTVIVFGDSHAQMWEPGLTLAAKQQHWKLINWTRSACPAARVTVYAPILKGPYRACDSWRQNTLTRIKLVHPQLVIIGESDNSIGTTVTDQQAATGLTQTIRALRSAQIPVTYLEDTPTRADDADIPTCVLIHVNAANACDFPRTGFFYPGRRRATAAAAHQAGARVVDTVGFVCGTRSCPVIVGNILVWRDSGHLTATYSRYLAPVLASLL